MSANGVWTRAEPSLERCRQWLSADAVDTLAVCLEPSLASAPSDSLGGFLPASRWFTLEQWAVQPGGACRALYRRRREAPLPEGS